MPARFGIAFVEMDAFEGRHDKNPYKFDYRWFRRVGEPPNQNLECLYIKRIEVQINGIPVTQLAGGMTKKDALLEYIRYNWFYPFWCLLIKN